MRGGNADCKSVKGGVMDNGSSRIRLRGVRKGLTFAMLSNIVLNELDHELEKRGLRYCRGRMIF